MTDGGLSLRRGNSAKYLHKQTGFFTKQLQNAKKLSWKVIAKINAAQLKEEKRKNLKITIENAVEEMREENINSL